MIAFEIHEGEVCRCANTGPYRRVVLPSPVLPVLSPLPPNKRWRRRWARMGKKNRCGARRIPAPQPAFRTMQYRTEVAHLLRGRGEVLLYLPDGERPTQDHCERVARCMGWT